MTKSKNGKRKNQQHGTIYRESKSKIQYGEKQTRGQKAKLYVNASWSVQREWRLQWIEQEKTKGVL